MFRIPALAAARREAPEPAHEAAAALPRRVLVVDDNFDAAATLDRLLRSLGHDTRFTTDGAQAIEMAGDFRPDVVLLDIGMPGMDGYEVAKRLRAQEAERRLKIVAVTGWGQEANHARSHDAGFDLHLVKPVDVRELAQALS